MIALIKYIQDGIRAAKEYNSLSFLPFAGSLKTYKRSYFNGDLRAGINVALLAFPQGMAYALIAGLPIQYGIYGSAIAATIGTIFAKSHYITIGPTNATSVLMFSAFASLGIIGTDKLEMVSLLVFMVGLILIVGAYFKVANLVQYISRSVVTGYITAAALLIITNQIPKSLGLDIEQNGATFYESLSLILKYIHTIDGATLGISVFTASLYVYLNKRFNTLPNVAICLVVVSIFTELLIGQKSNVSFLTSFNATQWPFQAPKFSWDAIQAVISTAVAIALLCIIEGISIGKSLAAKTGSRLYGNQAMFSIGMANIGCAFFSGVPASGSLTRSTLSFNSGAKSVLSSFISGLILIIAALLFGSLVQFIPQCALAVLVITIGISLIDRRAIKIVNLTTKSDALVFIATFISGLFIPLDSAIYVGVGISILLFLKKVAQPEMVEYTFKDDGQLAQMDSNEQRSIPHVSIVHLEGELFFGAADLFRDQMRRVCEEPNLKIVILKMRNAHHLDATGVMALEELLIYMSEKGRYLILSEVKTDMIRVLKNSGLYENIEARNIYTDDPSNPTLSTAKALKRAQEKIGSVEANISIYLDQKIDKAKRHKCE
ncbi:MAG: SulP family inorganic anion transporter [Verrucomicrobiota bacterium]|nr:SulP family inorganic anion transporter [Verrucomicrobiota bacterium]